MRFEIFGKLAERGFVHRGLNFFVRTIHLHEARLHDARERRVRGAAHLHGLRDVTGEDALLHRREEHVLVDRGAEQIEGALDDDADGENRPKHDGVHSPAAVPEVLPQCSHFFSSPRDVEREPIDACCASRIESEGRLQERERRRKLSPGFIASIATPRRVRPSRAEVAPSTVRRSACRMRRDDVNCVWVDFRAKMPAKSRVSRSLQPRRNVGLI